MSSFDVVERKASDFQTLLSKLECLNVAPCLMMGGPPPEQLPFLFNTAASPKFAAQLKSYETLESI